VGFQPFNTLRTCLPSQRTNSPHFCPDVWDTKSIALTVTVYYDQTDGALITIIKEHRRAVRVCHSNSKIAQQVNQFGQSRHFDHTTIIDKVRDYHKRLFLEAWHSQRDQNAGNEHIESRLRNDRRLAQRSRVLLC